MIVEIINSTGKVKDKSDEIFKKVSKSIKRWKIQELDNQYSRFNQFK